MPYIGKSPTGSAVRSRYYYTATASQTSVSGADDNGKALSFTDGEYVDVYLNGILLQAGVDYGTGTANTISSLSPLSAGQLVEIVVYDVYNVAEINRRALRTRFVKTASGSETSISGTDDNGATITFSANDQIEVNLNGVALIQDSDFNTNTANTVGGLSALSASDVVEIIKYERFILADTVSKADGGTFSGAVAFSGGISNLIRIQTFTANGTYTPSSNVSRIMVIVTGGGGSGGGYNNSSSSARVYHSGGGGSGSTAIKIISGVTSSYSGTVTIGSGGAGVNDAGSDGGTSSFADGTNTLSATGGLSGARQNNTISGGSFGGNGGTATGGALNIGGGAGDSGIGVEDGVGIACGAGGSSYWGGGGRGGARGSSGNADGGDGTAHGSGGGGGAGAHGANGSVDFVGGDGADGIVVVYEYL